MNCEEANQPLASYALGAIEMPELAELESHLEGCPTCRLVLEQHKQVVRELHQTVSLTDPPARIKRRLMERLDLLEANATGIPIASDQSRWSWLYSRRTALVGLAAALFLSVLGWSVFQTLGVLRIDRHNEQLTDQIKDLSTQNAQLNKDLERGWNAMTFATSPSVQAVSLSATGASPSTKASLFVDPTDKRALMMATGLTPATEGYIYELWLKRQDGSWASLGTFKTYKDGYVLWQFQTPEAIGGSRSLSVTLEPKEGSAWPTGKPILSADSADLR